MSKIGDSSNSNVSFRHLAMLAQVKTDEEIISSLGEDVQDRLAKMRNWIMGPHFPDELRIKIRDEIMQGLDSNIINNLRISLSNSEWNSVDISNTISNCFKNNEISPCDGYRNLYLAILELKRTKISTNTFRGRKGKSSKFTPSLVQNAKSSRYGVSVPFD